jgi:type I restriction enzyme S subunit
MKNLSNVALQNFSISLPTLPEQRRIENIFSKITEDAQRASDAYKRKLARLADLKQSILRKAFAGELSSPFPSAVNEAAE